MNIKGTKSEENLRAAFAGESMARNKYTYYAAVAKKEGSEEIAQLFEKMADNEREHGKIWFRMLHGGIPDSEANLQDAANGENEEWHSMYPGFARVAREEGLEQLAVMFEQVAGIEKTHEERFLKEYVKLKSGAAAVEKAEEIQPARAVWRCVFCGAIEERTGSEPPTVCRVCEAIGAFESAMV